MMIKIVEYHKDGRKPCSHFYEISNLKYSREIVTKDTIQASILIGTLSEDKECKYEAITIQAADLIKMPVALTVIGPASIFIMNNEAKTVEVIKLKDINNFE